MNLKTLLSTLLLCFVILFLACGFGFVGTLIIVSIGVYPLLAIWELDPQKVFSVAGVIAHFLFPLWTAIILLKCRFRLPGEFRTHRS